ncbi:MAG: hypothetical protein N4A31_06680 [Rickettsiales bacterium]|jgi:hypothetical protein|nr:hypothetical protein [Rickettsiales bacterium]
MKYKETLKHRPKTPKPLPTAKKQPCNQSDSDQITLEEVGDSSPSADTLYMGDIILIEDSTHEY